MNNKKKPKSFRPHQNPRYLIGSVAKEIWITDLCEYNAHLYKVYTAKTKLDTKPLPMNPYNYVNKRKLSSDAERLRNIDRDNKDLLKKINIINRTRGKVDTYNPHAYECKSRWSYHVQNMKKIEHKNKSLYQKFISAQSSYARAIMKELWLGVMEKLGRSAKYPLVILEKPNMDLALSRQPSISVGLEKTAERPLCFLEFRVQNGALLGRVIIELYHDHVPVTVQNFIALISGENDLHYKGSLVYRIIPGKYLETGDVTKQTGRGGKSIYGRTFAEEGHKLKHTKAGVLSMVRVKKHSNNSKFCITFANMEALDRQHVVFGKIVRGIENLFKIEGYGRRIGKPLVPIVISDCGKLEM